MPTITEGDAILEVSNRPQAVEAQVKAKSADDKEIGSLTAIRIWPIAFVLVDHLATVGLHQELSWLLILSGFSMTLGYWDLKLDKTSLAKFGVARIARLWPVHVVCMLLLIFSCYQTFKVHNADIPKLLANVFLLHAWVPQFMVHYSYNAASWASSLLMFLYATFPLLLAAMRKSWTWVALASILPTLVMIGYCNANSIPETSLEGVSMLGLLYIFPLSRLFEFAVGVYCGVLFRRLKTSNPMSPAVTSILEITTIVAFLVCFVTAPLVGDAIRGTIGPAGSFWYEYVGSTLLPWCALLILLATEKGVVSKMLDNAVLRFIGKLTFTIYMLHAVWLAIKQIHFGSVEPVLAWSVWAVSLAVACVLMMEYVEKPLRKLIMSVGTKLVARSQR